MPSDRPTRPLTLRRADTGMTLFADETPAAPPAGALDFLSGLNDVQRDAVTNVEGPTLIVAGAGSGKTRVLTFRIAYLLSQGADPWTILALTFTNKAAGEMKERVGALVGPARARGLWMGTFHSVFSRILRREAERLGFTRNFTIYDTDDSLGVVRAIMAELGISAQDYSPKMIFHRISSAKNAMVGPAEARSSAGNAVEERVALVYERYVERLRKSNAMDFDDLLVRTIELFNRFPDVLERYQEQFRYILIDEYQDTNRAQYTVVQQLAGRWRNVTVVGDDAQSIYKFRGADIRNILDFERDYGDYRIVRLEQNYRSTQTILSVADSVIRNNRNRIEKKLWTENGQGERARVVTARDEREEGDEVVQIVRREADEGRNYGSVAVLYRTNSQSLSIEDALRRANIPYALVGGVAFYRRREIKDALAYLRLLVNERDDESFIRAVNTPARGIGEVSMRRLRLHASNAGKGLLECSRDPGCVAELGTRATNALRGFAELVDAGRGRIGHEPLHETARAILSESGLLRSLKEEGTPEALARWDNVQRLLSHMAEFFDANPESTLDLYLQEIALLADTDSYDADAERVTMMTVHAAKGLEFKVVIVVGMEEGLFPIGDSGRDPEELEEERRLFYVAVTRARDRLYLLNCERRYRFGELTYPVPSRFLGEIDTELMEFSSTAQRFIPSDTAGAGRERRWSAQRAPAARPPKPTNEYADTSFDDNGSQLDAELRIGSVVEHPQFGRGRVEGVDGRGDKTALTVRFERAGRKKLMLKFANLRVVE